MFEVLLTEKQIISTLTILRSSENVLFQNKRSLVLTILGECRILTICEKPSAFYDCLKSLGPEIELWAGNQLACLNSTDELEPNPFRLVVGTNIIDLFSFDFESLLLEKECVIRTGGTTREWGISPNFGDYNNDVIIFDPFVYKNMDISVATIVEMYNVLGLSNKNNLIVIGSPDNERNLKFISDRDLNSFYSALEEKGFSRGNVFLLSVNVYHDREFISNTFRIKSGGSFDFMRPSTDFFQKAKATTIDLKSLLKSTRYQSTLEVIDILFSACVLKYAGKQILTDGERNAASGFDFTSIYKYWNFNRDYN